MESTDGSESPKTHIELFVLIVRIVDFYQLMLFIIYKYRTDILQHQLHLIARVMSIQMVLIL